MTDAPKTTREQLDKMQPSPDTVVVRESDEGVHLNVYLVSGTSVEETNARTYHRGFGHYFLEPSSPATETLDELLAEFSAENSVIDGFERSPGQAYEVSVEIVENVDTTEYEYESSTKSNLKVSSGSQYAELVDDFVEVIKNEVS